jgi:cobalt/nickel transport system permease protein
MGIIGSISGYLIWKLLRYFKSPIWLAAGAAGIVGDLLTYLTSAFELALDLHGNIPFFKEWIIFFMGYAPTQIPLAIAEGVFTAVILQTMINRRPDLMPNVISTIQKRSENK